MKSLPDEERRKTGAGMIAFVGDVINARRGAVCVQCSAAVGALLPEEGTDPFDWASLVGGAVRRGPRGRVNPTSLFAAPPSAYG